MLSKGDPAPDFTLPSSEGGAVTLSSLRGQRVVLYFYPKDDTSGCTIEACEFRDARERMEELDALVLGVSPDPVASHRKFRDKYDLNFPLLADEDHAVAEAYGVWKEKSMFGNKYWGVERSTFLIGPDGKIEELWRRVQPEGHAAEVAEAIGG